MNRRPLLWLVLIALMAPVAGLLAGGSGLNVAIIVNQSSSNSVQLGNYYCEQRQVPPQNFLRIQWQGGNVVWDQTNFNSVLLNPFLAMLSSRQLTNQIDYVVLSMDIPYRTTTTNNDDNSTTSTLFYGYKPDSRNVNTCPLADGSANLYAGSEGIFRSTPPISAASNSFLVTMITASNLALAKQIVDQGVLGDSTFPTQTVMLAKSDDVDRNIRYPEFDNTVFNTRLRGNYSALRTNTDTPNGFQGILGYQNGTYAFSVQSNTFVPGAMADNLTSFGGQIFQDTAGQTTLLAFLQAGAAGSFGTVNEPCNYPQKYPDPQNYFYQARGFSLAECYSQSVTNPYQGLMVGEPLSAPFAQPAYGAWSGLASNAMLTATTNLSAQFNASDAQHPVQQIDLFLDGTWLQTVTNIPPRQGDMLNVTLNGHLISYTVPASATIKSVTSGLAAALNSPANLSATEAQAFVHGDRIELQSTNPATTGAQISISASTTVPSGTPATFIYASRASFLDSIAWGIRTYDISGTPAAGNFLQLAVTRTNGALVTLSVTNNSSGTTLLQFVQQLADLINTNTAPSLQGDDGLTLEDLQVTDPNTGAVEFHLRARGQGYAAAGIQAHLTGPAGFSISPGGTVTLRENFPDLEPRNHLYVTAGATNLAVMFPFNTALLADGYHELAAVAYEGSHVHTQARATQEILIKNTSLAATFTTLLGGTNTALEATLQFSVTANTNNIAKIELFSTGGSLAAVSNQSSATFSIAATNLDLGLHPFYAVVTAASGVQYRTETKWIRLVGMESSFVLGINSPPPTLVWPATAGRSYDILSASNVAGTFQLRATVVPTNSTAQWVETNPSPAQQFYRVRVTP